MDNISALHNSTKVFQIVGLQSFDLKSLDGHKKFPSTGYKIYVAFIFIIITISFGSYVYVVELTRSDFETNAKNNLIVITRIIFQILQLFVFYASLFLSLYKAQQMVKFFQDAKSISEICIRDLNYKVNYSKLAKHLCVILIASLAPLSFSIIYAIIDFKSTKLEESLSNFFMCIPIGFNRLIHTRFYFYVAIINYQLEVLNILISKKLSKDAFTKDFIAIPTLKDYERKNHREMRGFKQIFILIKDMTRHVNDSMGFIALLLITLFIIHSIRFGYQFYMMTIGVRSNFARKFLILFHELFLNAQIYFSRCICIFWLLLGNAFDIPSLWENPIKSKQLSKI